MLQYNYSELVENGPNLKENIPIAYYITKELTATLAGTLKSEIEYDYSSRYYIKKMKSNSILIYL